jgi:hypothetical protein
VNTQDRSMVYVGLLRSTGSGFWQTQRYDGDIPGWGGLARGDEFFTGDLTGNGTDDLVIFNGVNWSMAYTGLFAAGSSGYSMIARYDGDIPGWGGLAAHDQLILGDFNGDGRCDLFIFNGEDWSIPYLGMFRAKSGGSLAYVNRYDGDVPGWGGMARHDRFVAADMTGDGVCDLWAWNFQDWNTAYLGRMQSSGSELKADYVGTSVGEWSLGSVDAFEPAATAGGAGRARLLVHNTDWFGAINGSTSIGLDRIYHRWIHDYRHGRNW